MTGAWTMLADLLAEDSLLLARATRGQDALEDAVQDAASHAWQVGRKFRSAAQAVAWLRARAVRTARAARPTTGEAISDPGAGWGPSDIEDAVDVGAAVARAEASVGDRAGPLLACIADEATLDEAGREMRGRIGERVQGLTRERARQCRDALADELQRWAAGPPVRKRGQPRFPKLDRHRTVR